MGVKQKYLSWDKKYFIRLLVVVALLFAVPAANIFLNSPKTFAACPAGQAPGQAGTAQGDTNACYLPNNPIPTGATPGGAANPTNPGDAATAGDKNNDNKGTTCAIDKIGWILCPIMEKSAQISDDAFDVLANNFLRTDPQLVKDNSGTKLAWETARNLANIMFIIAFLAIIVSQVTGAGISNYGIKKMIPRLIVAAIAVNVSYYICQLAVDLTNILGYEIQNALVQISNNIGPSVFGNISYADTQVANTGVLKHPGILFMIVTAAIAAGTVAFFMMSTIAAIIPLILITVFTIIIILMLRKALIVLLIVISPIAFVMYLLPNTEKLFSRWLNMFGRLLMVFPIVGLLFGAGQLASTIILVSGSDANASQAAKSCDPNDDAAKKQFQQQQGNTSSYAICGEGAIKVQGCKDTTAQCSGGNEKTATWTLGLVATAVAVAPLLAVWAVLKGALSAAGAIGGKISGAVEKGVRGGVNGSVKAGKGARDKYKNSNFGKYRASQKEDRNRRIAAGNYVGNPSNPLDRVRARRSRLNERLNRSDAFNKMTGNYGGSRELMSQGQDRKDAEEALGMFSEDDTLMSAWADSGGDLARALQSYNLDSAQQQQFRNMVRAGMNRKSSSYLAAAQYLSSKGKGNAANVANAIAAAGRAGASDVVMAQATQQAVAAARGAGRGDMVAGLGGAPSGAAGWSQVTAEATHREGLVGAGLNAYQQYLAGAGGVSSTDAVTKALRGYDRMEARAQNRARDSILQAARNLHPGATITSVEEAKHAFGITT